MTLYEEACRRPPVPADLADAIERVLRFIESDAGRAHDNCWVTSNFLMPGDDYWEADWAELPEGYVEILAGMGHELWQAVEDPMWAENFGGLPNQLLSKLNAVRVNHAG